MMDFTGGSGDIMSNPVAIGLSSVGQPSSNTNDFESLFNSSDYFDLSAMSPPQSNEAIPAINFGSLGEASAPFDTLEGFAANMAAQNTLGNMTLSGNGMMGQDANGSVRQNQNQAVVDTMDFSKYDFSLNNGSFGRGGETLAGEGMDTVSDGLKGGESGKGL